MFEKSKPLLKKNIAKSKLTAILKAKVLLSEPRRQECIQNMLTHIEFTPTHLVQSIHPLLNTFASNCQLLPSTQHHFYTQSGGLIDYSLFRALSAMQLFRQIALPPGTKELSAEQFRISYILFSAAILKGIGCIFTDFQIDKYNSAGTFLETWNPLWTYFEKDAEFYYFQQHEEIIDELRPHLTPLIAKFWMPEAGLNWVMEDAKSFLLWLQLLQEEHEGLNILEAILERAEALSSQEMFRLMLATLPEENLTLDLRRPGFIDSTVNNTLRLELIGLQFIQWLNENLARGQMLINQTPIVALENGLQISPDAFKWFIQHHPQFKNWRLIQQGLMSLGLHDKNFNNNEGLIIKKFGLLLPNEVICKQKINNQHIKLSAISLTQQWKQYTNGKNLEADIFRQQLNAKGEWENIQQKNNSPGFKNV